MTRKLILICVSLFYALMLVNVGANFYSGWAESERGWEAGRVEGKPTIHTVDADGPAAVLRVGDEIISLKGEPQGAFPLLFRSRCAVPPGTGYKLTLRREGQTLEFDLFTAATPLSSRLFNFAVNLSSLAFLIIGLTVFLLKPDDKQARLLAFMFGAFVGLYTSGILLLPKWTQIMVGVARSCGVIFFFPFFLHFFLLFPDRGPWVRRFPRLEFWLYLPFFLLGLPIVLQLVGGQKILANIPGISRIGPLYYVTWIIYLFSGLVALIVNYRAADTNNKRRMRVVVAGCCVGFLNILLIFLGAEAFQLSQTYPSAFDLIGSSIVVTLPLIPLSFAYAIIRHQVIPVSLIIRRSVRYLLVSRGSILLELIAVTAAVTAVLTYIFSRSRPSGIVIGLVSAGVGIAAWKISEILHDKYLAPLIDRHFFRQSYDAHQIITELTGSLRTITGLPQLLELVATKIQTALQTEHVTIFLRDPATGNFNSACSRDHSEPDYAANIQPHGGHLMRYARMVEQLDQLGKFLGSATTTGSIQLESDNGRPVEIVEIGPDDLLSEHDGAALLMPLLSKDEMLGIISLGPRLGDLPFSREDKQLLMSVSGPTTLAIENARLVEQMVAEARRLQEMEVDHRRKTEELAYARQFQLSMLPARNVMLDNIEIIGRMRTASEVGGDYYDFIEMADGRICIAVGDATGHGMAAGLVGCSREMHCFG
jgi:sigma-B regulation protein RsbU (phosphoserine phosphatase)